MHLTAITCLSAVFILLGASCKNMQLAGGDHPTGTGPFDRHGNYVEAWADNPAMWRGGDRKPTPVRPTTSSRPAPALASNTTTTRPAPAQTQSRPTQTVNRPAATASTGSAQARPQTTQARPKPRPQPQPTRYTVKRGDTLSAIARRNGTTVAALRRANGISGDLIRPGQVLRIPR